MKDFFFLIHETKSQTNSWNLNDSPLIWMNEFILRGFHALFFRILKNKKNETFSEKKDFNFNKEKQFETKKFFS